jgi:membrane protease YdiL (CAAX protease family)
MKRLYFPVFFLLFYIAWIVRATWFYYAVDASIQNETWQLAFSIFIKFILWVLPAAAFVYWLDRENPLEKMKVNTPVHLDNLVLIASAGVFYFFIVFLFEYWMSNRTLLLLIQTPLLKILSVLAGTSLSPVVEELLFRGFVLYKLGEGFPFWKANLIQAFLFTAMHWPYWIWTNGLQTQLAVTSVGIFILALFLGWVLKKGNSIWPPVLIHIVNNLLAAFLG